MVVRTASMTSFGLYALPRAERRVSGTSRMQHCEAREAGAFEDSRHEGGQGGESLKPTIGD